MTNPHPLALVPSPDLVAMKSDALRARDAALVGVNIDQVNAVLSAICDEQLRRAHDQARVKTPATTTPNPTVRRRN